MRHNGKKVAVVGSGPIGIEATVALRKRGYEVHLVELLGSVLPKSLDEECSALVAENLCKNGVDVVVGETVSTGDCVTMYVATKSKPTATAITASNLMEKR